MIPGTVLMHAPWPGSLGHRVLEALTRAAGDTVGSVRVSALKSFNLAVSRTLQRAEYHYHASLPSSHPGLDGRTVGGLSTATRTQSRNHSEHANVKSFDDSVPLQSVGIQEQRYPYELDLMSMRRALLVYRCTRKGLQDSKLVVSYVRIIFWRERNLFPSTHVQSSSPDMKSFGSHLYDGKHSHGDWTSNQVMFFPFLLYRWLVMNHTMAVNYCRSGFKHLSTWSLS